MQKVVYLMFNGMSTQAMLIIAISIVLLLIVVYTCFSFYNTAKSYSRIENEQIISKPLGTDGVKGRSVSNDFRLTKSEKNQILNNPLWNEVDIARNIMLYDNVKELVDYLHSHLVSDMDELGFTLDRWFILNTGDDNQHNIKTELVLRYRRY